ncbi:MAG: alkaline phosphatase family protein [Nanoarchaeota archaeon]|nr:alkaline phosphatase family protein [Nanoarchaeota archaeon]
MLKDNKKKKLIIVAIDGGNFPVINPFLEKKLLPNLASFKHKANLISVIPPATAVAWASFSTGNNPGKTEIYDFTLVDDFSWKVEFLNRKRLQGKPLWQYLSEAGVKSCFINLPVTYPPDEINGVIVSGIETPSTMCQYTYPSDLKDTLNKLGYEIEVSGLKEKKEDIVEEAENILDKRIRAAKFLFQRDFDFFIVLFRASDIVQHFAWDKPVVEEVHKKIDDFIGYVRKKDPNAEVMVISDHGIEKIEKVFNINSWLEQEGYLFTKIKKASILSSLGITRKNIFYFLEKTKLNFLIRYIPRSLGKKIPVENISFEEALSTGLIDMEKTRAVAKRSVKTAQIFLNDTDRKGIVKKEEEEIIQKEIKEKLEKFFDERGIKAIIQTKAELYGEKARFAPDVTLYLEEKTYEISASFTDKGIWVPLGKEEAEHCLSGIILTNLGLNLNNARIIDLAPTILDYFKVLYKKDSFDGRSLFDSKSL